MIERDGVTLALDDSGEGRPVVLAHGLTATRRYVVMGSTALQRSGHRVIAYDARGHGASSPAPDPGHYTYEELGRDLEAVLDGLGIERAVLAGASMGAHTLLWLALAHPERVAGLVVITPAYDPESNDDPERLAHWDALADGLRSGGIDGLPGGPGRAGGARAMAGDRDQGDPAAPCPARASRRRRRRAACRAPFAAVRRDGGTGRDLRPDDDRRLRATRPTPSTRSPSARPTRRRSPAPASSPTSPAAHPPPGRAASSRG